MRSKLKSEVIWTSTLKSLPQGLNRVLAIFFYGSEEFVDTGIYVPKCDIWHMSRIRFIPTEYVLLWAEFPRVSDLRPFASGESDAE